MIGMRHCSSCPFLTSLGHIRSVSNALHTRRLRWCPDVDRCACLISRSCRSRSKRPHSALIARIDKGIKRQSREVLPRRPLLAASCASIRELACCYEPWVAPCSRLHTHLPHLQPFPLPLATACRDGSRASLLPLFNRTKWSDASDLEGRVGYGWTVGSRTHLF